MAYTSTKITTKTKDNYAIAITWEYQERNVSKTIVVIIQLWQIWGQWSSNKILFVLDLTDRGKFRYRIGCKQKGGAKRNVDWKNVEWDGEGGVDEE